jgi:choline dehydrogenase
LRHQLNEKSYDYVIVGSGAAGSVLAERLSRDPAVSVLVLEAGGWDRNPLHRIPKATHFTMTNPRYTKTYRTEPRADGSVDTWYRGRVIGGSTTINGMMWNRGWAPEYDAWEARGIKGWNWQRFLAAFKALEAHQLGASTLRGGAGLVPISVAAPREPVSDAFITTLASHGISYLDDLNSSGDERVGYVASNIRRGLRVSAARSFLHRAHRRPNVTVLDRTEVERVTFHRTVATGIQGKRSGRPVRFMANREVLLCCGALESPLLLERSGIGDAEVLEAAGVPLLVESPKVGERLQDHCGSTQFQLRLKGKVGFNPQVNNVFSRAWSGLKYLFSRAGVLSFGAYNIVILFKSDPAAEHPDTQGFFTPISATASNPRTGRKIVDKFSGAWFLTYPLFPTSTGSIHISGPDATDAPRLIPSIPQTDFDVALTLKMYAKARAILATDPFASMVDEQLMPDVGLSEDEDVLAYASTDGALGYHSVGTCAIGPDEDDVVDDRLRVRGTSGLRVVDASVFPAMPSGNNNAPTQALAWIAADLISEDASSRGSLSSNKFMA